MLAYHMQGPGFIPRQRTRKHTNESQNRGPTKLKLILTICIFIMALRLKFICKAGEVAQRWGAGRIHGSL